MNLIIENSTKFIIVKVSVQLEVIAVGVLFRLRKKNSVERVH